MANIKRLQELLENVVPHIPPRRLRMSEFFTLPNGCGTVACVAGWAGLHTPFNQMGYRLVRFPIAKQYMPAFNFRYGFCAIQIFFDIDTQDAQHIFGGHNSDDPVEAAQRIIDVIEANTPSEET